MSKSAGTKKIAVTKHTVGDVVIHATAGWTNGNSPVGLMLAARAYAEGRATPSHLVHKASETCEHC